MAQKEIPPDDPQAVNRPLEPKSRPGPVGQEGREPGEGTEGLREEPPHHRLNNPVGEPDPTSDSDPYEPHPEAGDPPPPGQFPGPGPEPRDHADERDDPPPEPEGDDQLPAA
jgi:hypothetical protein